MKRDMKLGKHTSASPALRKKLKVLYRTGLVARIIFDITSGNSHTFHDGKIRFKRTEGKKVFACGYGKGITSIVIITKDENKTELIKNWITENG